MRIGIDAGSYYLKIVGFSENGELKFSFFSPHKGRLFDCLRGFKPLADVKWCTLGLTGVLSNLLTEEEDLICDEVKSLIKGCLMVEKNIHNIIHLGASTISLIKLNENGELLDFHTNSICAAGTGSFLDQQAQRMNIKIDDFSNIVSSSEPPPIAARCSVFAKSDLIHRQQEGYSIPQLWCGLCKGLSTTITSTLLRGSQIRGKTIITGGVALNQEVVRWLKRNISADVKVPLNPHLLQALGAAHLAQKEINLKKFLSGEKSVSVKKRGKELRPPLNLDKSRFFSEKVFEEYVDDLKNEVRVIKPPAGSYDVSIGFDIGSTSTKLAVLDERNEVLIDIYRKTEGDPVGATRKILSALQDLQEKYRIKLNPIACGTTGSGRKLVGQILGADKIVNEITAHAKGACFLFGSDIETIFEIGGQDSKYIHLKNGRVDNVNMNYVCAAGTGSFIEEQANKLGIKLQEIGDLVMGISPPFTSDRCTVFMEQDVEKLLREGFTREEAMAAVLYSVCFNYLTKVVGKRPVTGERILFQGATARNKGLVCAFEKVVGKEILTSHFCHVTGAIGCALIAKEYVENEGRKTKFRGIDVWKREIKIRYSHCEICSNKCKITFVKVEGEKEESSWGYMCGREPDDNEKKRNPYFEPFERRMSIFMKAGLKKIEKKRDFNIIMPRALATHSHLPLWRAFFSELGIPLSLTRETDREIIEEGINLATSDFCFPVKIFMGHVSKALEKDSFLFIPHLIRTKKSGFTSNSLFCPYVQACPSIARSCEKISEKLKGKLLNPVIDLSDPHWMNVNELHRTLKIFGFSKNEILSSWLKAIKAFKIYKKSCLEEGRRILDEVEKNGEKAIVIFGRFYNIYDGGANLEIPRKLAELGIKVIPCEFLPFDEKEVGEFFKNMFWDYGQRFISSARYVKSKRNLFLLYLTNFSCGPDSFILSYVEEIMGNKPYLILEIDEHGADAGYGTRLEAFLDVINEFDGERREEKSYLYIKKKSKSLRDKIILIPPMHPSGAPLFASAFRKHGYSAEVLPRMDVAQFELGRKYTRGTECLPLQVTTGNLLYYLMSKRKEDVENFVLFMPTSDGPCRFGQYATLQRIILNKLGYEDLEIISPSAQNAYMGLDNDLRKDLWRAILTGDVLFKMFCKIAPYEKNKGETKCVFEKTLKTSSQLFETGEDFIEIIKRAEREFLKIPILPVRKPLVGIVGEIFVRCNPFSCDYLVDKIIDGGGEPWLSPVSEWILYTSYIHRYHAKKKLDFPDILKSYLKNNFLTHIEHRAYNAVSALLSERREPEMEEIIKAGGKYFPLEFTGEAILTVGRAILFIERDGAELVVNASPFTCMPGNTTASILQRISREKGVPVINMFYDGSEGMNEKVIVFLRNIGEKVKYYEKFAIK